MLYDADQGFGSDVTFADACMAVFVSAKRIQAVIQVDGAQTERPMTRSNSVRTSSR